MSTIPSPPPPRTDVPKPDHMTDERYAAFLTYLAGDPPASWRDTDGTIYLKWMPSAIAPPVGLVDSRVSIPPDDPNYSTYVTDLLPQFDYQGKEKPDAAGAQHDAQGG